MANVMISEYMNQLREENNRLLNENKVIYDLLDNYRNISIHLQNICVCNQKSDNDFVIKSLEDEYQRISLQRQNVCIKTEVIHTFETIDTQSVPQNDHKLCIKSEGNDCEKSAEDMDTDYGVSDANDTQFGDGSDTETREDVTEEMVSKNLVLVCDDMGYNQRSKSRASLSPASKESHKNKANSMSTPEWKCKECNKTFLTKRNLLEHKRRRHLSDRKLHCCHYCDFGSNYLKAFNRHMNCEHCDKLCADEGRHQSQQLTCHWPECGHTFISNRALNKHVRHVHKRYVCEWPGCLKRFVYRCELRYHVNKHQNPLPYKCSVEGCGKAFDRKNDLNYHNILNVHNQTYDLA